MSGGDHDSEHSPSPHQHSVAADHSTEDNVLAVQPWGVRVKVRGRGEGSKRKGEGKRGGE